MLSYSRLLPQDFPDLESNLLIILCLNLNVGNPYPTSHIQCAEGVPFGLQVLSKPSLLPGLAEKKSLPVSNADQK